MSKSIKLYIYENEFFIHGAFVDENEKLCNFILEEQNIVHKGDIFVGQVIKADNNYAFILYDPLEKPGFFSLEKDSVKKGDMVLVQIIREEQRGKGVMLTKEIVLYTQYFKYIFNNTRSLNMDKKDIYYNIVNKFLIKGHLVHRNPINDQITLEKDFLEINNFIALLESVDKTHIKLVKKSNNFFYNLRHSKFNNIDEVYINNKDLEFVANEIMCDKIIYYKYPKVNLDKLLENHIQLSCGAYIIINITAAGTTIDVNRGRCTNPVFANEECAREIMLQLRIKNIGGLVFIDFLKTDNYDNIIEIMEQEKIYDTNRIFILPINSLGVCTLSRQSISASIYSLLQEDFMFGTIDKSKYLHYKLNLDSRKNISTNYYIAKQINEIPHDYNITIDNNINGIIYSDDYKDNN